ncbi:MAG: 2-nitropropane dioxygenase, partial [Spirochaetales bacterium]|nr:2-nitropropane dioxygenase [Spirochaetales bacterium]
MPANLIEKLWKRGKDFLGVDYPILGGAMSWISESNLVSAISNGGGFGVLAGGNMPVELFKAEIDKTFDKTDKPFGVNLISIAPNFRNHLDYVLESDFPFVIFAGGLPPRDAISKAKQAGCKVLCFAPTVGIAERLIKSGVDALIIEGHEAGGHIGPVSTAVLAEQILPNTRDVPVFVAGGIGTGLMMVHYLLMGASGVQLGTKFAVADECPAHDNFKDYLIRAGAKDAQPTAQFDPRVPVIPVRALLNEGTTDFTTLQLGLLAQLERDAITPREAGIKLEEFWIGGLKKAAIDGDVENGSLMAGQSVG